MLKATLGDEVEERIDKIYDEVSESQKIRARCRKAWEVEPFLEMKKAQFKIVVDLANLSELLNHFKRNKKKILSIYVYNDEGENGFRKAMNYKKETKKIKEISPSIDHLLRKAEKVIDHQVDEN